MSVSIIIPAYNAAKSIERCLDSILAQEDIHIIKEVLVIDDGSKDNTADLVKSYENQFPIIRLIKKNNGGVSSARNEGIRQATGEYLVFCDSDDELQRECCSELYYTIKQNHSDMVICGYEMIDNNSVVVRIPQEKYSIKERHITECFDYFFNNFFLNTPWGRIYQRDKISVLFDENLQNGEDIKFNLDYLRCNPYCKSVNQSLYKIHTDRENSLSRSKLYALAGILQTQMYIGKFVQDLGVQLSWYDFSDYCLSLIWTNIVDGKNLGQFSCKEGYEAINWTSSYYSYLKTLTPKRIINKITKIVIKNKSIASIFFETIALLKRL